MHLNGKTQPGVEPLRFFKGGGGAYQEVLVLYLSLNALYNNVLVSSIFLLMCWLSPYRYPASFRPIDSTWLQVQFALG